MYDRMVIGGAAPVNTPVHLTPPEIFKASYFLERRELGIINVGGQGAVMADGKSFILNHKDGLYLGKGTRDVVFLPGSKENTPLYYFISAPAHRVCSPMLIAFDKAEKMELGSPESANQRTVSKIIAGNLADTCQLQMGLTDLKAGSIWNTMPPHTHNRRTEVYFYFNVKQQDAICHFMGPPHETKTIWVQNHQAVISPPWSIHAGAGTSAYSFIWGMAGENIDYNDMDKIQITELK